MLASPAYERIAARLRSAILKGRLANGTVLLEGPVAEIFKSSRSPVRKALETLSREGLVYHFEGRGLIVGDPRAAPIRAPVTAEMLQVDLVEVGPIREPLWRKSYEFVERDLIYSSVLDSRRINENELARHYEIGRAAAGQILNRAESNGIVARDDQGRWSTICLDEKRLSDLYQVRLLLEPAAMRSTVERGVDGKEVSKWIDRVQDALGRYPDVQASELDRLEHDLHVSAVAACGNSELVRALRHTRSTLLIGKHAFSEALPLPSSEPFMEEHLLILKALEERDLEHAQQGMREHIEASCGKVSARLPAIREFALRLDLPYLSENAY